MGDQYFNNDKYGYLHAEFQQPFTSNHFKSVWLTDQITLILEVKCSFKQYLQIFGLQTNKYILSNHSRIWVMLEGHILHNILYTS